MNQCVVEPNNARNTESTKRKASEEGVEGNDKHADKEDDLDDRLAKRYAHL